MDNLSISKLLEIEKQNAIAEIESLMMRLESAKKRLLNDWPVNGTGIVQGAAALVDTACARYMALHEIAKKLD